MSYSYNLFFFYRRTIQIFYSFSNVGYFRKKSPAASNSSSSKGDQPLLLDSDSNGHRECSNLELKELKGIIREIGTKGTLSTKLYVKQTSNVA